HGVRVSERLGLMRTVVLVAILAALSAVPVARADGDPASDYLLGQSTFIPPDPYVPPPYANQLAATVQKARSHGYTIRVAVIGKRYTMGSVGVLWNQPEPYARFLGQELAFQYRKNLLVVMPNGFGVSRGGKPSPAQQSVVDRLESPGRLSIGLVSA